jgi:hypothetical protein
VTECVCWREDTHVDNSFLWLNIIRAAQQLIFALLYMLLDCGRSVLWRVRISFSILFLVGTATGLVESYIYQSTASLFSVAGVPVTVQQIRVATYLNIVTLLADGFWTHIRDSSGNLLAFPSVNYSRNEILDETTSNATTWTDTSWVTLKRACNMVIALAAVGVVLDAVTQIPQASSAWYAPFCVYAIAFGGLIGIYYVCWVPAIGRLLLVQPVVWILIGA